MPGPREAPIVQTRPAPGQRSGSAVGGPARPDHRRWNRYGT